MKVSFDGMRRCATSAMNDLHNIIDTVLDERMNQEIDLNLKEQLIKKFNYAAFQVDSFNCLFDDDVQDDLNDLTDELNIKRLREL